MDRANISLNPYLDQNVRFQEIFKTEFEDNVQDIFNSKNVYWKVYTMAYQNSGTRDPGPLGDLGDLHLSGMWEFYE